MTSHNICPYEHYYKHQAGSGVGVIYKGAPYQRGHGIGSFLGGLFRSVLPLLKNGAKAVGKEMMNTGVGLLSDMVNNRPLEESVKNRVRDATSTLKRKVDEKVNRLMSGSGYKNKRLRHDNLSLSPKLIQSRVKKSVVKKQTKRNHSDIFSNL